MDKIMQAHAETDIETVYTEQGYGPSISAHTFFLSITESANGHFCGEICNLYYEEAIPFDGLDKAILRMNMMMDDLGCPQAATELRCFESKRRQGSRQRFGESTRQEWEQRYRHYWNKKFMQAPLLHKPQIQIEVLYRQNATWQGTVSLLRPFEPCKVSFRSALELMYLINSAYQVRKPDKEDVAQSQTTQC